MGHNFDRCITEIEDPTSSIATNEFTVSPSCVSRPTRTSAIKARQNITNWTRALLSSPPRMFRTDRLSIVIRISTCI